MTADRPLILIVEDESALRRFLRATLGAQGFATLDATTAGEAVALATSHLPALVLLDLGLPDRDGLEVTRQLREWSQVPIVVLSARGREDDKIAALDAGADDYLTKPFGPGELMARIRVALRHAQAAIAPPDDPVLRVGPLEIDVARHELRRDDVVIKVTPLEFKLALTLARHAGKVVTHRQLLREVWGPNHGDDVHYLRVYMAQLRRKLEPDPARPRLLITEPGVGYRLRDD
jgi:two-component system KDP operon response regulator KdpE